MCKKSAFSDRGNPTTGIVRCEVPPATSGYWGPKENPGKGRRANLANRHSFSCRLGSRRKFCASAACRYRVLALPGFVRRPPANLARERADEKQKRRSRQTETPAWRRQ